MADHETDRGPEGGRVVAVSFSPVHSMRKENRPCIRLVAGFGVEGDAHGGATVRHRSRVKKNPHAPNLRQVHLIPAELFDELRAMGFEVEPGRMGENVTTRGVALLSLPTGTRLRIGPEAVVEVTGLRNPCTQLDAVEPGLMQAVLARTADGCLVRKAGVMGIVLAGGEVAPGDPIEVELPAGPHRPLECV